MSDDKKDVTIKEPDESLVPAVLGAGALGRGHEEVADEEDYEIPRAKLIQPTSDEATADNQADQVPIGKIINSMTKKELPDIFIPIFLFRNYIQWNPRKKDDPNYDPAFEPGELIFQTVNRTDPRVVAGVKFGDNGEAPKVTKYLNFFSYFVGHPMPLILSFSKSSMAAGKRLFTLTQYTGGDMFKNKFKLSVIKREEAGTKFFVFDVKEAGLAGEAEFKIAEAWYNSFRGKKIKVHEEAPQGEDTKKWAGE